MKRRETGAWFAEIVPIARALGHVGYAKTKEYQAALESAQRLVAAASVKVFTSVVQVALAGELRDLDAALPAETPIEFAPADFLAVRDPHVVMLLAIHKQLFQLGEQLAGAGVADTAGGEEPTTDE